MLSRNRAPRVCRETSSRKPAVISRARFASCTGQIHDTAFSTAHVRLYPVVSCILGLTGARLASLSANPVTPGTWQGSHYSTSFEVTHRLVGLVVKASASWAADRGLDFSFSPWIFFKAVWYQWLPFQAPGVIGSALGLVGPVSVHCDWVRRKVCCAVSISVWQRVKLSEQIGPWDTLACYWDVKQASNQQTFEVTGVRSTDDQLPRSPLPGPPW